MLLTNRPARATTKRDQRFAINSAKLAKGRSLAIRRAQSFEPQHFSSSFSASLGWKQIESFEICLQICQHGSNPNRKVRKVFAKVRKENQSSTRS